MTIHQPYETWMFDEDTLTNQQKKELYEHLIACPECSKLRDNWESFHKVVRQLPEASPSSGFTHRWRTSLQARKEQHQRKQVQHFIAWLFGALCLSMGLLVVQLFTTQSFFEWTFLSFTNGVRMVMQSGKVLQALVSWVQVIPPVYSLTVGLIFISMFGLLGLAWVYLFVVYVYRRGGPSYEKNA